MAAKWGFNQWAVRGNGSNPAIVHHVHYVRPSNRSSYSVDIYLKYNGDIQLILEK